MCKFGTQCRFLHPADLAPSNRPSVPPAPNSGARSQANQPNTAPDSFSLDAVEASLPKTAVPCKFFLQGMCARGTACRFAHVQSASTTTEDCPICMTPITPPKMFGLLCTLLPLIVHAPSSYPRQSIITVISNMSLSGIHVVVQRTVIM